MMLATHSQRLERWLGPEIVKQVSDSMLHWYGPPIPLAGVPGGVWAMPGGGFRGRIGAGQFAPAVDFAISRLSVIARAHARAQRGKLHAGFSSLSDIIAAGSQGKARDFLFQKAGPTGVVNVTSSLWGLGATPAAGANASSAPGGDAPTDATTGAFPVDNPPGGETRHLVVGEVSASVVSNTLLLYDRIFQVAKTMASTATEAVSGTPSRYQSVTNTDPDYAGGNFLFVEVGGTALAATGHNWTTCLYTDQDGNTGATLPSLTGNSSAIVRRLDHPAGQWFAPLAAGDTGIKALTQMQCSASVATGVINFVIGHALAFMPCPAANLVCIYDGINTAFGLARIFDDAALAFLEITKPATTATNYTGRFRAVHN